MIASVAFITRTPVPLICERFTLGQVCRYAQSAPRLGGGGGEHGERVMTDPREIRAFAAAMGIKPARKG